MTTNPELYIAGSLMRDDGDAVLISCDNDCSIVLDNEETDLASKILRDLIRGLLREFLPAQQAGYQPFARIFNTPRGQVLCMLDTHEDEDRPMLKFITRPEGLGLCHVGAIFEGEDADEQAQAALEKVTQEMAEHAVAEIWNLANELTGSKAGAV